MADTQGFSIFLLHCLARQEAATCIYQELGSIIRLYLIKSQFTHFLPKYGNI